MSEIDPNEHLEHCPGCEDCAWLLEFYMACDFCGTVGQKDADGWGEPIPDEGIPCCHCEQEILSQRPATQEASDKDRAVRGESND